jgi:mandelate racemase
MIVRRVLVRAVQVPLRRPLATSARVVDTAPLLLVDVETEIGIVGRAYLFCYDALGQRLMADVLEDAAALVAGATVDPRALRAKLARRWRLFGTAGPAAMALAGLDVALWDALVQEAGQPLARFLGAESVALRCYNSNGLGLIGPAAAAAEAGELVAEGYDEIKLRLGYATLDEDLLVVRAVRSAVADRVRVVVDYNQLLDRDEGLRRCAALDGERLGWIEEPIAHDDFAGAAAIAARVETPVQIGENLPSAYAAEAAVAAGASDLLMFDLLRIGGVSGWLDAGRVATHHGVPLSSHLFPEVSVHLLAVSPTRDRIEMVDWGAPILQEPLRVRDGRVAAPDRPGTGVRWDEDAVKRYSC